MASCPITSWQIDGETMETVRDFVFLGSKITADSDWSHEIKRPWFDSWVGKIFWRRDRLPTPVFLDFPSGSAGKESACSVGDLGSIPGLGRSPGEGKGYPLQYSGLENSMDCIVHGIAESDMTEQSESQLSP